MLLHEIREIKSGRTERHQFAVVIAVALLLIAAFLAWRKGVYPSLFIAAGLFVLPVLFDKIFRTDTAIVLLPLQKIWMAIAVTIGFFVSRIILGIFFFGVFTSVRLLNGLFGKDLLDTAWKDGRESYWLPRAPDEYTPEKSERQY